MPEVVEKLAHRINEAARLTDLSRDTLERLIARGEIKSWKIGSARLISDEELRRFIREREQAAN